MHGRRKEPLPPRRSIAWCAPPRSNAKSCLHWLRPPDRSGPFTALQNEKDAKRMIIRSVRLKNIKSYGNGPDGKGVTVSFQPGVNRVAGGNGHGKTTLIESVGY